MINWSSMVINKTVFRGQKSRLLERAPDEERWAPERFAEQPSDAELVEGLASCAEAAIAPADSVPPSAVDAEEEGGGSTSSSSARSSSHSRARAARRVASRAVEVVAVQLARPGCGGRAAEDEDGTAEAPGSAPASTASSGGRFSSCAHSKEEERPDACSYSLSSQAHRTRQHGKEHCVHFNEQKARANKLEAEHWTFGCSAPVQVQRIETPELEELEQAFSTYKTKVL